MTEVETLETHLDGEFGGATAPGQFDVDLLALTGCSLQEVVVTKKYVQVLVGG